MKDDCHYLQFIRLVHERVPLEGMTRRWETACAEEWCLLNSVSVDCEGCDNATIFHPVKEETKWYQCSECYEGESLFWKDGKITNTTKWEQIDDEVFHIHHTEFGDRKYLAEEKIMNRG